MGPKKQSIGLPKGIRLALVRSYLLYLTFALVVSLRETVGVSFRWKPSCHVALIVISGDSECVCVFARARVFRECGVSGK